MAAETFTSQVAIITGGAQGLGESVARILARNGCSVMIFDANVEKARVVAQALQVESGQSEGGRFEACCVDVSDEASVLAGFEVFRTKFNRLDIMVNCAGILGPNGLTEEIEVADFDRVWAGMVAGLLLCFHTLTLHALCSGYSLHAYTHLPYAVNTRGSFLMTKYSLLEMKKRNYGRILLIASMAGKEVHPCVVTTSVVYVLLFDSFPLPRAIRTK